MKKTVLLILALLLVLLLLVCFNSNPKEVQLPVKFGKVISIEAPTNKSEVIVLSMEEPSSSKGAERDVYIAAVDYIFSHASKDLKELSVTAYAPNGDCIIAFTMPSHIIGALRIMEAQGSWGTEGFAALFYMNHEEYEWLVESCVPYDN